jgi:hypothetical protein
MADPRLVSDTGRGIEGRALCLGWFGQKLADLDLTGKPEWPDRATKIVLHPTDYARLTGQKGASND